VAAIEVVAMPGFRHCEARAAPKQTILMLAWIASLLMTPIEAGRVTVE
jgi:hypothetical protein